MKKLFSSFFQSGRWLALALCVLLVSLTISTVSAEETEENAPFAKPLKEVISTPMHQRLLVRIVRASSLARLST